jgi:hypothetical protein
MSGHAMHKITNVLYATLAVLIATSIKMLEPVVTPRPKTVR